MSGPGLGMPLGKRNFQRLGYLLLTILEVPLSRTNTAAFSQMRKQLPPHFFGQVNFKG